MEYNVYCDESCHLEHDKSDVMSIGAVYCPKDKLREINSRLREIKIENNVPEFAELKWTRVSPSKLRVYKEIVNYFFDDDDLHFRVILIPDKKKLNHQKYNQTHDDWYYKMYFEMLKNILNPSDSYNIYIDIKDTNSYMKAKKLHEVCCNSKHDFKKHVIRKLQPIRSDEVQIMQLTDLLVGAITHYNRFFDSLASHSSAKAELIEIIKNRTNYSLTATTLYRENKFNIFVWEAQ